MTKPENALKLRNIITILARIWLQSCKKFNGWIKRNQAAPFHHVIVCNSWCSLIIKEGDVGSDNGAVSKSRRECITTDNPHHRDAHQLTKNILILRLYKPEEKPNAEDDGKEKDETERERKRTGRIKRIRGREEGELGSTGRR